MRVPRHSYVNSLLAYICSLRSKALLSLTASSRRFGVRCGDVASVLIIIFIAGGCDMRKQNPATIKMASCTQIMSIQQGKSVIEKRISGRKTIDNTGD